MPPNAHVSLGGIGQYQIDAHLMALGAGPECTGLAKGITDEISIHSDQYGLTEKDASTQDLSGRKFMSARISSSASTTLTDLK